MNQLRPRAIILGGPDPDARRAMAAHLAAYHGYQERWLGDLVDRMLYDLNPALQGVVTPLAWIVQDLGWRDAAKAHPEIDQLRAAMNKAIRKHIYADAIRDTVIMDCATTVHWVFPDLADLADIGAVANWFGGDEVHSIFVETPCNPLELASYLEYGRELFNTALPPDTTALDAYMDGLRQLDYGWACP